MFGVINLIFKTYFIRHTCNKLWKNRVKHKNSNRLINDGNITCDSPNVVDEFRSNVVKPNRPEGVSPTRLKKCNFKFK